MCSTFYQVYYVFGVASYVLPDVECLVGVVAGECFCLSKVVST